jgi:oligopeptidase A
MNHSSTPDSNPLLERSAWPAFDRIRPEHVGPAIDSLLAGAEAAFARIHAQGELSYDELAAQLDVPVDTLSHAWGLVNHLNEVASSQALREAIEGKLGAVTDFLSRLAADERLFQRYKSLAGTPLSAVRQRVLKLALMGFELSGAQLQGAQKVRFLEIEQRAAELAQQFSNHVMDATDAFHLDITPEQAEGLPDDVADAARAAAAAGGSPGMLRLTLHQPCYVPAMQNLRDRSLRATLHRAFHTRASDEGPAELDNSALIAETMALRAEAAQLLGYATPAHVGLRPKMAGEPQTVLSFLDDMVVRVRPVAAREIAELRAFAASHLGIADLQAWDQAFVAERLREARYAYSEQELKSYFTEPKVLEGLFGLIESLFGVRMQERFGLPTWHESVRVFEVMREGEPVAAFYLDAYARPGKSPGAWQHGVRERWLRPGGELQKPLGVLVCNHAAPLPGQPALLSHDDLITLFHEFGHGLHHLLTQVNESAVAGINGVEWDAVELPSQFMENYCWEWVMLQRMSAHVHSGQPLSRELFDKLRAARRFLSGLGYLRQAELGLFDMRLHLQPEQGQAPLALLKEVQQRTNLLPPPPYARLPHSFSHIFAGGYSAGYYSYLWAEVLSADAYAAFEETDPLDVGTGQRWLREVLEVGGSRPAMQSFTAFRGREPTLEAWLRHQGLAEVA